MLKFSSVVALGILFSGLILSPIVQAELVLQKQNSSVHFVSTKNEHITEVHSFDDFSGTLDSNGKLNIKINLISVNTLIPIRNERLQTMLFDTANFSSASFNASIDKKLLSMPVGSSKVITVDGNLTIKDKTVPSAFDVIITSLPDGKINATTIKPTIVNASQFGLDAGVDALQKIAMLKSISKSVPLTFSVTFK